MITGRKLLIVLLLINVLSTSLSGEQVLPEIKAYKLDLKFDFDNDKLYGKCEMTLKNRDIQPVLKVHVLLYRLLTIKSIESNENIPLPFTQEIKAVESFEKLQVNYAEVLLPKALLSGEETKIIITYDGYLLGYVSEGWRYVKDHIDRNFTIIRTDGFGYPVIGYPTSNGMMAIVNERYNHEINITLENGLEASSGGELLEKTISDETTFKFRSKKPSWRIDIAIADFLTFEKGKNRIYYFKNDSTGAGYLLDALDKSIKLYSQWFGNIDNFQGYSIIEVPEGYGSQQDVTSFYITADNFRNPDNMLTIYHETSHLWNVKSLDSRPCRFESEGLAQFLEFLMSEKLENKENVVVEASQQYLEKIRNAFSKKPEYQNIPLKDYGIRDMTEYSYTLGMVVFATYYNLIGQHHFNRTMESFYSKYSTTGATLDEFINVCKSTAPIDLEIFFNDWIYSTNGIKLIMDGNSFKDIIHYYLE